MIDIFRLKIGELLNNINMERSCSSLSNDDETLSSDLEVATMEWLMNDGTTEKRSNVIDPTN